MNGLATKVKIYVRPPAAAFASMPRSLLTVVAAVDVDAAFDAAAVVLDTLIVVVLVIGVRQPKR
jgi:hypothetical protein